MQLYSRQVSLSNVLDQAVQMAGTHTYCVGIIGIAHSQNLADEILLQCH